MLSIHIDVEVYSLFVVTVQTDDTRQHYRGKINQHWLRLSGCHFTPLATLALRDNNNTHYMMLRYSVHHDSAHLRSRLCGSLDAKPSAHSTNRGWQFVNKRDVTSPYVWNNISLIWNDSVSKHHPHTLCLKLPDGELGVSNWIGCVIWNNRF